MESPRRYLLSVALILVVAIGAPLAAGLLQDGSTDPAAGSSDSGVTASDLAAETPRIARQVEEIRGIEFDQIPDPEVIGVAELGELFREEYRKPSVREQISQAQDLYEVLGMIEPSDDLQETFEGSADLVAGAYNPDDEQLYVIGGPTLSNRAIAEITLAHELDHALEDQVYGLPDSEDPSSDRALAESAFVEGSATSLMLEFGMKNVDQSDLLSAASDPDLLGAGSAAGLPKIVREQIFFSYFGGQNLVDALRNSVDGSWNLVDVGYRSNIPTSTEQVIHPFLYLKGEQPIGVSIPDRVSPGPGWSRKGDPDTFGELQSSQMLEIAVPENDAEAAAAGWGGDNYQLWSRGEDSAVLIRWRWDTPADAAEFEAALRLFAEEVAGGSAVVTSDGGVIQLAIAPSSDEAERLAGSQGL